MTSFLFVSAILILTLEGLVICRLRVVAEMDVAGRIAIAFATGLVLNTLLLLVESAIGISWSRLACWLPSLALVAIGIGAARRAEWRITRNRGWIPIALILLLMTYGAATSRLTSGDLLFFWGPKAVRFADAGKIDIQYLGEGSYYLAHPDYPPR